MLPGAIPSFSALNLLVCNVSNGLRMMGSHIKVIGCVRVCVNIFAVHFNLKKTSLDQEFPVEGVL